MAIGRPLIQVLAPLALSLEAELGVAAHEALLRVHTPRLQRKMARLWREQGRVFLREAEAEGRARFGEASTDWWGPAWDAAVSATRAGMIQAIVEEVGPLHSAGLGVVLGAAGAARSDALVAAVLPSLQLPNPRAVAFLGQHAARRVTGIDATTEDQMRRLIAKGADEGASWQRIARQINQEFRGFGAPAPQKYIRNRAELVATTELAEGYGQAQRQMATALRGVGVPMEKSWLTGAADPCDICELNADDGWMGIDDQFSGGVVGVPQHPACLPGDSRVLAEGVTAASKRWFDGDLVVVHTASGQDLRCTLNHPILTPTGWVAAGLLDVGGHVVRYLGVEGAAPAADLHDQQMPACVHDVAEAFGCSPQVAAVPVPIAAEDFHGDGAGSEVAVIWAYRLLRDRLDATRGEEGGEPIFVGGPPRGEPLAGGRGPTALLERRASAAARGMGGGDLGGTLGGRHAAPLEKLGLGSASGRDGVATEPLRDGHVVDAEGLAEALGGCPVQIACDEIVGVERLPFSGHVYNLETARGWYVAEGIITHNCRCDVLYRREREEGAPPEAEEMDPLAAQMKAVEDFEREWYTAKIEHGGIAVPGGAIETAVGEEGFVRWTGAQTNMVLTHPRQGVFTHNHPIQVTTDKFEHQESFSIEDIEAAARTSLAEMRAVTRDYVHSMKPGPQGWPMREQVRSTAEDVQKKMLSRARRRNNQGLTKPAEFYEEASWHNVWTETAKRLGMVYERRTHGYGD